jgi:hypothetical protein
MRKLGLAFALVACSNNHDPRDRPAKVDQPPAKPQPLEVTWSDDSIAQKFTVKGGHEKGDASGAEKGVSILLEEFEPGTKWAVGGKQGTLGENDHRAHIEIDALDKLAQVAYEDIEHVDTGLALELTLPDGRQGQTKIPPLTFKYALKDIFKRIEHSPVTFGKEPEDHKPADSMFYVEGGVVGEIVGRAGKLSEIDFVATQEKLPEAKGKKECGGYTGPRATLTILLKETQVTVWNRRTGEIVEKKTFAPKTECPMFEMVRADESDVDSMPPSDAINAWLKSKIKR